MSDQQNSNTQANDNGNGADFDFDAWLGEQPEHVRKGYDSHTGGLKSALETERTQRKDAIKQLRELSTKAEKGSEAEKALGEMTTQLERATQRAAFMEEAIRPEIGCANPKAAFLVAQADSLFKRSGEPDWAAIKAAAPELFARKTPKGDAGNGRDETLTKTASMNNFIRSAAGRG